MNIICKITLAKIITNTECNRYCILYELRRGKNAAKACGSICFYPGTISCHVTYVILGLSDSKRVIFISMIDSVLVVFKSVKVVM